eukprot:TRINITY_DN771_c0_g1_i1.p1 TRINITY_DN771_c0_g1~~TRINITY_DN771_c0_g1_i1.p1  ORF type:complete len:446 (-),score=56.81 TRINITY_DN771_c0_g1_i1:312-1649(-)
MTPTLVLLCLLAAFVHVREAKINVPLTHHSINQYRIESIHHDNDTFSRARVNRPTLLTRSYDESYPTPSLGGNIFLATCEITMQSSVGPQTFNVQIDTGSILMAVPDLTCSTCTGPTYLRPSPTDYVSCSSERCTANTCSGANCLFKVQYLDQSGISGSLVYERVTLGGLSAFTTFGSITTSSSNFQQGYASGIMGLSYNNTNFCSPSCVPSVMDSISSANNISNIFTILIDYNGGGSMVLGGYDEDSVVGEIGYTNVISKTYYVVSLNSVSIGGVPVITSGFGSVIVDSGTSFLLVPTKVYGQIKSLFQSNFPDLPLVTGQQTLWSGSDYCFLDSTFIASFPSFEFAFDGVNVTLPPQNYLFKTVDITGETTVFCLGIHPTSTPQTILGDVFIRGLNVVFDKTLDRVGFGKSSVIPPYPIGHGSIVSANFLLILMLVGLVTLYL